MCVCVHFCLQNSLTGTIANSLAVDAGAASAKLALLNLAGNELTGAIPEFYAPSLTAVNVSGNQLTGALLLEFTALSDDTVASRLVSVDVSGNLLTGINSQDYDGVDSILAYLDASHNQISVCLGCGIIAALAVLFALSSHSHVEARHLTV